jgi:hypothetical protein
MKHAGAAALANVSGLIAQIRTRPGLVEKQTGVFYRKGQAFLRNHEDWLRLHLPDDGSWITCLAELDRILGGKA